MHLAPIRGLVTTTYLNYLLGENETEDNLQVSPEIQQSTDLYA